MYTPWSWLLDVKYTEEEHAWRWMMSASIDLFGSKTETYALWLTQASSFWACQAAWPSTTLPDVGLGIDYRIEWNFWGSYCPRTTRIGQGWLINKGISTYRNFKDMSIVGKARELVDSTSTADPHLPYFRRADARMERTWRAASLPRIYIARPSSGLSPEMILVNHGSL